MDDSLTFKGELWEIEILAEIFKLDTIPDSFKDHWGRAMKCFPEAVPFFFEEAFVDEIVEKVTAIGDLKVELKNAAQLAREDERIMRIAWLWYYICYRELDWRGLYAWPHLCNALGTTGNLIPILILLSEYNGLSEFYLANNIPYEYQKQTYDGIDGSLTKFREKYTEPGSGNAALAWVVRYIAGKLFYLGRLQYEFSTCNNNIFVYRNSETGECICLDSNGYIISPESHVLQRKIELDENQWELVLKKGDKAISIHIPGGRSLDNRDVRESLLYAEPFFSTYFPQYPWRAFTCNSWLLDTQLRQFLNQDSNIIKFQDNFYLFPGEGSDNNANVYKFLFNRKVCPPEELQANTTLQRNVRDHLIAGGTIRSDGGFILREDLGKSEDHYKANFQY